LGVGFSVSNTFETKQVKRDSTGEVRENIIRIIENLNANISYNFAAEQFPPRMVGDPGDQALAQQGEKILFHISNFRPVKRVEDVVRVFARIRQEGPARLIMVGDGPERPRAQRRAEELGVDDGVMFPGKHLAVEELLACADLFLLPSESESFGLAALEAMACGTPVVASAVGGLLEVVEDGRSGHLLPAGDLEGMSRAALRILSDEARWEEYSRSARDLAVERFSADRVVPVYEDFYREILADG
jgi:N-acetyl-alpha-D-glucosaminyl L-malate synthase BshA